MKTLEDYRDLLSAFNLDLDNCVIDLIDENEAIATLEIGNKSIIIFSTKSTHPLKCNNLDDFSNLNVGRITFESSKFIGYPIELDITPNKKFGEYDLNCFESILWRIYNPEEYLYRIISAYTLHICVIISDIAPILYTNHFNLVNIPLLSPITESKNKLITLYSLDVFNSREIRCFIEFDMITFKSTIFLSSSLNTELIYEGKIDKLDLEVFKSKIEMLIERSFKYTK